MSENLPDPSAGRQREEHSDSVSLTVGLEQEFKRMLEAKAKRLGISISELIGRILRADLSRLPPPTKYLICMFALLAAFCSTSFAGCFTGRVARVIDGDTVVVLTHDRSKSFKVERSKPFRVRLAGVDAPELKESWGQESKTVLSSLVLNEIVVVQWSRRGRYRRIIGHIYLAGRYVNQQLIALGWARHFRRYSKDKKLEAAEERARQAARGMWGDK